MSTKKNGTQKLFENMPVEPEHAVNQEIKEAVTGSEESRGAILGNQDFLVPVTSETDARPVERSESVNGGEQMGEEVPENPELHVPVTSEVDTPLDFSEVEPDDSPEDDILDDVRRSLIEEEAQEKEKQPRWWKRIGKGSRKNGTEEEALKAVEEISIPALDVDETAEESRQAVVVQQEDESEEYVDQIDDLIDLLEAEEIEKNKPVPVTETPVEPENVVGIEELKKQAFQPRPSSNQDENLTEVRAIALEGDEEVFVEVESTSPDQMEERLAAVENAFKPYRRYINFGLAFLGFFMAVIAGMVLFNLYRQTVAAQATEEVVSNLPFPTSVSLPGGWSFNVGKGSLVDGRWNPKGAEWLQGTEVCRWVALPWSRQLEAVIRTLNPDDPIDLGMSNNDTLTYKVHSIQQMSPEEMRILDSNSPCLLIVLAEPDAEKRWVLTALP